MIEKMSKVLTSEEAVELAESGWWKGLPAKEVALAQLQQERLCMDFGDFHKAVEDATGRSVFTHEFVNHKHLAHEIDPSLPMPSEPYKTLSDSIGGGR